MSGIATGLLTLALALPQAVGDSAPSSPAPSAPRPLVAATFYAWYDHPTSHFVDGQGRDSLRDHFVDAEAVHADSPEWYAGELELAADAGLDLFLFASVTSPIPPATWSEALAAAFERVRGRLSRPVKAGLLLEPRWLAAERLDLADEAARSLLADTVISFFRTLRSQDWARIDGAPLVVVGRSGGVLHAPPDLFEELRRRVGEALGVAPHLVVDRSWKREGDPGGGAAGPVGAVESWREGSAILGPQRTPVASLAPGYDDRQLERPVGVLRLREGGRAYEAAWQQILEESHPLVIVESWNQMHDGTAIAPSLDHGRRYVELTRRYAELLREGRRAERAVVPRFDSVVGAAEFAADRRFSTLDDVSFRPGDDEGGILLSKESDAQLSFVAEAGEELLVVRARSGRGGEATLRFDVGDAFPFSVAETFDATLSFTASEGATAVELFGATPAARRSFGGVEAAAGETREAHFRIEAARLRGDHDAEWRSDLELRVRGGPIAVRSLTLRRTHHRLRADAGGEPPPFHRVELRWRELEPQAGSVDERRLVAAIRDACNDVAHPPGSDRSRCCGVVVLDDPPAWATPAGTHPDAVAAIVRHVAAAMAEVPAMRFLELFPRANDRGTAGDPQGHLRVLRAAAAVTHEVAPHVALTLGAIRGPDVAWLRTIEALKQPFVYDAATFELDDESGIPGDATCERELARLLAQWSGGGDREKPFFVERRSFAVAPPANGTRAGATLLPELLRASWKRLAREPGRVDVLDAEALPLVRGAATGDVVASLRADGIDAVPRKTPDLVAELATDAIPTLVLAQGELFPAVLAPGLPPFLDRGGLLVCLGGAPFRRAAARLDDGGFTLEDERPLGMELRDALRIAVVTSRPAPAETAALEIVTPATAPDLDARVGTRLDVAALFTRRTGRPRDPHGFHRYEALLHATRDGRTIGDVAALIDYSAGRRGALLLVGVDGGGRRLDAQEARDAGRRLEEIARRHDAMAVFELPAERSSGDGR